MMGNQINIAADGRCGVTVIPDFLDNPLPRSHQTAAKGVAFAGLMAIATSTAIASSTIIEPVIATPIDTVVPVGGSGLQDDFIYELWKQAGAISATSSAVLTKRYSIDDLGSVEQYLAANSDLIEFLNVLVEELMEEPRVKSVELELYRDSEEHWEKLFVLAATTIDDVDELSAIEDELFMSLFQPNTDDLSGRVVLSVG